MFTARDIVQALRDEGFLSAAFENTGGWVMEGPGIGIDDIVVTW